MRTAEASLAVVTAIWLAACAGGCGADTPSDPTGGAQVGCIYGGTPAPTELALTTAETNALADLDITGGGEDSSFGASCTGLLVDDGWILTAAHCTRDPATTRVTARFGPSLPCQSTRRRAIASAGIVTHPTLDLMLVRLAETPAQAGIQATPLRPDAGEDLHLGDRVQLAGYGWTEDSSPGQLRFVAEAISALDETWMEVDGRGVSGACVADSGGPLLWRDAAGVLRTAAVLSDGSADCVGVDRYVRLRSVVAWLSSSGV